MAKQPKTLEFFQNKLTERRNSAFASAIDIIKAAVSKDELSHDLLLQRSLNAITAFTSTERMINTEFSETGERIPVAAVRKMPYFLRTTKEESGLVFVEVFRKVDGEAIVDFKSPSCGKFSEATKSAIKWTIENGVRNQLWLRYREYFEEECDFTEDVKWVDSLRDEAMTGDRAIDCQEFSGRRSE